MKEPKHPIIINWQAAKAAALVGGVGMMLVCFIIGARSISAIIAASGGMAVFCGLAGAIER